MDDVTSDNVADMITSLSDGLIENNNDKEIFEIKLDDNVDNVFGVAIGNMNIKSLKLVVTADITDTSAPVLTRGTATFKKSGYADIKVTAVYKNNDEGDKSTNMGYLMIEQEGKPTKYIGQTSSTDALIKPKVLTGVSSIVDTEYLTRGKLFEFDMKANNNFNWSEEDKNFILGLGSTYAGISSNPIESVAIGDTSNNILARRSNKL